MEELLRVLGYYQINISPYEAGTYRYRVLLMLQYSCPPPHPPLVTCCYAITADSLGYNYGTYHPLQQGMVVPHTAGIYREIFLW